MTREKGKLAEQLALNYLKENGLELVIQNYRCRLGEIDLIMREGHYLVFIEVRSRSNRSFGGGIASITYEKKQKIIKTTSHYMIKYRIQDKFPIRFDVISIDGTSNKITWLKNAFDAGC
ncbi:YraN family protein [Legionella sp. PATHC032]|uniref:YraN family protein n=1 Tax=Legionella sp. PATHC032 TaxID=2992039 RepID=UPI001B2457C6|nr:YraN family protein [Legionella sp. PATHC032]MCW8422937.1 YraN family protein [Legionella sp. PATHC032]HAZ7574509.1 YraN family protein [Legionella pneumophila]HBA1636475.1 YraN family protein [Legionella pneumophila]